MTNLVLETLMKRRSVKDYDGNIPSEEELDAILEAGLWAPNGMGKQVAVMVLVKDKAVRDTLSHLNASVMGQSEDFDPFYNAPVVVAVLADKNRNTWIEDGALVIGNMLNAASSIGISSCWIHRAREVFMTKEGEALKEKWGLSHDYEGVGFCILGYGKNTKPASPRMAGRIIKV